jgi:K+-transporting ATPase KdpF subunit
LGEDGNTTMSYLFLAVGLLLVGYLLFAMLRPERF